MDGKVKSRFCIQDLAFVLSLAREFPFFGSKSSPSQDDFHSFSITPVDVELRTIRIRCLVERSSGWTPVP